MADVTGTIRKVCLAGVTYDVFADSNINATPSRYQNEAVATSGRAMRKMTRRVPSREGVTVVANGAEQEALKALSESQEDITMSYETAAGDVYRASGFFDFESHETEENRASIIMHPREDWEPFLA